jgi:predicted site-specific integrase-resolvase
MELINAEQLFNIEQTIEALDISRVTFYTWVKEGKITITTIADKTFVSKTQIEKIKADREAVK